MTSESVGAIDLLKVPQILDVRLLKVMAFGNRTNFKRTEWAAHAQWRLDGHPRELPPSMGHPRYRWCIELNGDLHREQGIELPPSHREPNFALMVRSFDLGGASCAD
jgi:hypothetical protein